MAKNEKLKFYDLKKRKSFTTDKYKVKKLKKRHFAITKAPSGAESWRIISKVAYDKCKK